MPFLGKRLLRPDKTKSPRHLALPVAILIEASTRMQIAILSDIHDNLSNLDIALPALAHCDEMICCGDLCSPFVIDELASGFPRNIHIVFGNNDADLFRITTKSAQFSNVHLYGEFCELQRAGKGIAVNHFDYIARPIAQSNKYEFVCFGHNHTYEITRYDRTLALNPGAIMGTRFPAGKREDTPPTFLILDVETGEAQGYQIERDRKVVKRPEPVNTGGQAS
jgi:hypothetical protein